MNKELNPLLEEASTDKRKYLPWSPIVSVRNDLGVKTSLTPTILYQLFQSNEDHPEQLSQLAMRFMGGHESLSNLVDPKLILPMIPDQEVRKTVEIWCVGKDLIHDNQFEEEKLNVQVGEILEHEAELIETLSPWMNTLRVAEIIAAIRGYRTIDPNDKDAYNILVTGVYRLASKYLGVRRHYQRNRQAIPRVFMPELSPDLLHNPLVRNNYKEALFDQCRPLFVKNPEDCFAHLDRTRQEATHTNQLEMLDEVEAYWQDVMQFSVSGLNKEIAGSQKDKAKTEEIELSTFPARHQQEFGHRLVSKEIGPYDLLIGDAGTMKTAGSLYGVEAAGARSTIVLCPPTLRDKWETDIHELYEDTVDVIKIEREKELRDVIKNKTGNNDTRRFLIISYNLLSRLSLVESPSLFRRLKRSVKPDSLIADEVHLAKEKTANCTQQAYLLSRVLDETSPRVAMTATGVVNSIEDLDAPVRILLPYEYPEEGSFTRSARNDPHAVRALLHGKQLMTRWYLEEILGEELPPTEIRDELVPLSPFHQYVYEHVYYDDTIEDSSKRNILRQAALDPQLMKFHYTSEHINRKKRELRSKVLDTSELGERKVNLEKILTLEDRKNRISSMYSEADGLASLQEAYKTYYEWAVDNDPDRVFDEDFLAEFGYGDLALWAFFTLPGGMQDIADKSDDSVLRADWENLTVYSSKYRRLIEMLDEQRVEGQGKTIIYSGFFREGVTSSGQNNNLENSDEISTFEFDSLYDILVKKYIQSAVRRIDGTVSIEPKAGEISEREHVRIDWRTSEEVEFLLATIRSSRLGIDLIPLTDTDVVRTIFLDLPDTYADIDQGIGRTKRQGQRVRNEVTFMKAVNAEHPDQPQYGFIDHGMSEATEFKRLLAQLVLDDVPLTHEEDRFVKSHLTNLKVTDLLPQTPRRYLYERFFPAIRGKGYKSNKKYLEEEGFEGMSNAEFFARAYDDSGLARQNAKVASETIRKYKELYSKREVTIASIGAGSGILERTLGQKVVDLDMLFEILQVGKLKKGTDSDAILADAAHIPIASESVDVADLSLMVHWSKNASLQYSISKITERIRVLSESVRITKQGGLISLSVPADHLTPELFANWKEVFEEHLGIVFPPELPSGLVWGTDYKRESICWIFNGIKQNEINNPDAIDPDKLTFDFESTVKIITPKGTRAQKGERTVASDTDIPHSEFEITDPSTGIMQQIQYVTPTEDLMKILLDDQNQYADGHHTDVNWELQLLSEGSIIAEQGYFTGLVQYAHRRWDISMNKAQKLAYDAVISYEKQDSGNHYRSSVENSIQEIMTQLNGGDTYDT